MSFLAQAVLGGNRALIGGNGHADRRSAPAIAQVSRPSGSWLEPERLPDVAASDDGLGLMHRIDELFMARPLLGLQRMARTWGEGGIDREH